MLKVLIIDDEPFVREGLTDLIHWETLGFTVCATGHNGKEGLEKIMKYQPEVVLIDIRMPGLSGIEVIKQVQRLQLTCQFIILSGYSDFQYAKESIGLGVMAYLLKPVDEDELVAVIQKVRDRLNEQFQYAQFKHQQQLRNLLSGQIQDLALSYQNHTYQLVALPSQKQEEPLFNALKPFSEQMTIITEEEVLLLIFIDLTVGEKIKEIAHALKIQMAISQKNLNHTQVAKAYGQVKKLLKRTFCFEGVYVFTLATAVQAKSSVAVEQLYLAIEFNNEFEKKQAIKDLEGYYQGLNYSPDRIKGDLVHLNLSLIKRFAANYPNLVLSGKDQVCQQIEQQKTLQGALRFLLAEWNDLSQLIQDEIGLRDNTIQQMQHYVQQYYDQELNLKVLGDIFNYNPTYLGKKFKLQVGASFPKYVDKVRIEKSMEFLVKERMKVYEVSEKVGYCNIDYFYRKFKNYVGKSPKEYQKECLRKEGDSK